MKIEEIRAYNRPFVLFAFMVMVCVLVYLDLKASTLISVITSVGTPVGFYIGIKGKDGTTTTT